MDISKCTFKNGTEENEIVVVVSESGRSDVKRFEVEVETSLKVPNTCTSYIVYNTFTSSWNACNIYSYTPKRCGMSDIYSVACYRYFGGTSGWLC